MAAAVAAGAAAAESARRLAGGGGDGDHGLNAASGEVIAVATIGCVLLLQYATHLLDNKVEGHKHSAELVAMMYKELMILGVVAFGIFAIEQAGFHISLTAKHNFEIIHMSLFIVAVLYALLVVVLLILSRRLFRKWNDTEALEFAHYQAVVDEKNRLKEELKPLSACSRVFCARSASSRYLVLLAVVRYHELRLRFIADNELKEDFKFAGYLRKCAQHVFLELIEIHESGWVFFVVGVSIDLYFRGMLESYEDGVDISVLLIGMCIVVSVAAFVLFAKMQVAYYTMIHSQVVTMDNDVKDTAASWHDMKKAVRKRSKRRLTVRLDRRAPIVREVSSHNLRLPAEEIVQVHQLQLFWMLAPELILRMVQLLVFILACMAALMTQAWSDLVESGAAATVATIVAVTVVGFIFFVSKLVPLYTLTAFTGELTNPDLLAEELEKQERKKKKEEAKRLAALAAMSTATMGAMVRQARAGRLAQQGCRARVKRALSGDSWTAQVFIGVFLLHIVLVAMATNESFRQPGVLYGQAVTATVMLLESIGKLYGRSWHGSGGLLWQLYDSLVVATAFVVTIFVVLGGTDGPVGVGIVALLRLPVFLRAAGHHLIHEKASDVAAAERRVTSLGAGGARRASNATRARRYSAALQPMGDLRRMDTLEVETQHSDASRRLSIDLSGVAVEQVTITESDDTSAAAPKEDDVPGEETAVDVGSAAVETAAETETADSAGGQGATPAVFESGAAATDAADVDPAGAAGTDAGATDAAGHAGSDGGAAGGAGETSPGAAFEVKPSEADDDVVTPLRKAAPRKPALRALDGWLHKADPKGKHYKRRFFYFTPETCSVTYHDSIETKPKGTIELLMAQVRDAAPDSRGRKHAPTPWLLVVETVEPKRTWYLSARTEDDLRVWRDTLSRASRGEGMIALGDGSADEDDDDDLM